MFFCFWSEKAHRLSQRRHPCDTIGHKCLSYSSQLKLVTGFTVKISRGISCALLRFDSSPHQLTAKHWYCHNSSSLRGPLPFIYLAVPPPSYPPPPSHNKRGAKGDIRINSKVTLRTRLELLSFPSPLGLKQGSSELTTGHTHTASLPTKLTFATLSNPFPY